MTDAFPGAKTIAPISPQDGSFAPLPTRTRKLTIPICGRDVDRLEAIERMARERGLDPDHVAGAIFTAALLDQYQRRDVLWGPPRHPDAADAAPDTSH